MMPKGRWVGFVRFDRGWLLHAAGLAGCFDVLRALPGPSPARRVEAVRPEHARRRLGAGDPSVASIAHRCGSGREGRARRAFRRAPGSTPLPYRRTSGAEEHGA